VGVRVVVVDDNPHVSWEGATYPVNATFHRFLAAVLDVPGAPVASIVHCVPLRLATAQPATLPLDARLEVVGTAPFDGIGGYLRQAPSIARRNAAILRPVIASADLVWIKVPASNAPLAGWLAWRAGVPRFGYVAGSALAVARGRGLGLGAQAVGVAYDLAGMLAGGRRRIVVGHRIIGGGGIVTSLVEPDEVRDPAGQTWPSIPWRTRLAWAGRLTPGKGLETVFDALGLLAGREADGHRFELILLGDGPARGALQARAESLGINDRIHWLGFVADRATYLDALAKCDVFVFPSPAEGFPKAILDAMAVGLPVVASDAGSLVELADAGLVVRLEGRTPDDVATAISGLIGSPAEGERLRREAHAFVAAHTRPAEAARLVTRLGIRAAR
jgi:hypothetical protein